MTTSKIHGCSVQFQYSVHGRTVYEGTTLYIKSLTWIEAYLEAVRRVQTILSAAGHSDVRVNLVEQLDMGV
jgi:hypothetical protein